jgi:hypothetical protein
MTLVHRVIVPDKKSPKEYAILVTDTRSVFIRQEKTRSNFWLRGELKYGTALVTDVIPKTLEDYEQTSLDSLAANDTNLTIPHEAVVSLGLKSEEPRPRWYEFPMRLTVRNEEHRWRVYNFEMNYKDSQNGENSIKFYLVPLGMYVKPRRATQTRETILREYAMDALEIFQKVLPTKVNASATKTASFTGQAQQGYP